MAENLEILTGDCRAILPTLEAGSVQCCISSPPYWGLRDYGTAQWQGGEAGCDHKGTIFRTAPPGTDKQNSNHGANGVRSGDCHCGARRIDSQLGLEATPEEYIANMVAVFREVWRVLRDDGTLWLNLGDSYNAYNGGAGPNSLLSRGAQTTQRADLPSGYSLRTKSLKPKDLCMMPARVALALQADGWYLRSDIIWHKPNPMPESVTDRPTKAHEYIFLLTKAERYFYDAEAIKEPANGNAHSRGDGLNPKCFNGSYFDRGKTGEIHPTTQKGPRSKQNPSFSGAVNELVENRNKRTVWTIATQPFSGAHFATFPEEIPKLCILAGSKPGDIILDPFAGSGTTGQVALELGRRAILIELSPAYLELARDRTFVTAGFF